MLKNNFALIIGLSAVIAVGVAVSSISAAETLNKSSRRVAACSVAQGQALIDAGSYEQAINKFECVIDADATAVEGYRGRIEAEVLAGRYSDAVHDYQRVTAFVLPVNPDAKTAIVAGYDARLAVDPQNVNALTGLSFARWWNFDYASAIHVLNELIAIRPNDVYPNLFRGSSRLLSGATKAKGVADLDRAISLAPTSPHVRFIVADAYTYGLHDYDRAFAEASLALAWRLGTPRIHAILGAAYNSFGDLSAAADHVQTCIDLVTTELVPASPIVAGTTVSLGFVPGRTYDVPISVAAGETISIATSSRDYWDTILVLLAPDGTPVLGRDDDNFYFAAFDYIAQQKGTYHMKVTFFESVATGELVVTRR